MKKGKTIQLKIVIFTTVKNRCMLHGRVFVMISIQKTTQSLQITCSKNGGNLWMNEMIKALIFDISP